MGPLHLQLLLPTALLGPIDFQRGADDTFGWAHDIYCCCCCRWPRLGLLIFWKVLTMPKDRPIEIAAASAGGFTWDHCFSRRRCQRMGMGQLHLQQQQNLLK